MIIVTKKTDDTYNTQGESDTNLLKKEIQTHSLNPKYTKNSKMEYFLLTGFNQ